ncbi:MAG: hypothetical protein ACI3XR_06870 [Eubacteriales bacterium]
MSLEKIEKEHLNNDLIQQDIMNGFRNDSHMAINIILIIVSVLVVFCFSFLTPYAWFALLIPALILILWYIKRMKRMKKINNIEFTVVLDELLYEKQGELRTVPTFYKGKWISYLQFLHNGRWEMEGNYYSWSDQYKMSSTGICNTSSPKDMFYVVLYKDTKEIAIAYNTKFFEYKS